MSLLNRLADKILAANPIRILLASVFLAEMVTAAIVSICSVYFHGEVHDDYLLTGVITSLIASLVVVALILVFSRKFASIRAGIVGEAETFRNYLGRIQECIVITELNGNILYANDKFRELAELSAERFEGKNLRDILSGDDAALFAEGSFLDAVGAGMDAPIKVSVGRESGSLVPVRMKASEIDYFGKKVAQIVFYDITEFVETESKLKALEKVFSEILARSSDTFFRTSFNGEVIWISSSIERLSGYKASEVVGKSMANYYYDPSDRFKLLEALKKNKGTLEDFQARMVKKDGTVFWISTNLAYMYSENGSPIGLEGVTRDITRIKKVEEALRESEEQYRVLLENLQEGVFLIDGETVLYANRILAGMVGYQVKEMIGENFLKFIAPEDKQMVLSRYRQRLSGADVTKEYDFHMLHKDGQTRRIAHIVANIVRYKDKVMSTGTIVDITDRRKLEVEALRGQKLESVGILAGGIAHDFNNLLTSIMGGLSVLKANLKNSSDDETGQILEEAMTASRRAKDLTGQLLTFSKGGRPAKKVIDLKKVLFDSASFALRGSHHTFKLQTEGAIPNVEADEGQISQVINNLVINADEAMPEGGVVTVKVGSGDIGKNSDIPLGHGKYAWFEVTDSGIGISPEHIGRIFDPYFTSKKRGSGLGLATSYSIVKNHGGIIRVESIPGKGSTFKVYLPSSGKALDVVKNESVVHAGKGKVLVMDDEDVVRNVMGRMLKKLGYEVEFAINGEDAVSLYRKRKDNGEAFDLVITDLTVPGGMGGEEVVQALLEENPGLKAIASSGYTSDEIMTNCRDYGFSAALVKPFDIELLGNALKTALED